MSVGKKPIGSYSAGGGLLVIGSEGIFPILYIVDPILITINFTLSELFNFIFVIPAQAAVRQAHGPERSRRRVQLKVAGIPACAGMTN